MIEPVRIKHQNPSFQGLRTPAHDPLNARSAYSNVIKDNKEIVKNEHAKLKNSMPFRVGKLIDFKG